MRGVDSSLLDEWERLKNPAFVGASRDEIEIQRDDITQNTRVFTALIRNLFSTSSRALQSRDYETAKDLLDEGEVPITTSDLERAFRPFFEEGMVIALDATGRSPSNTVIDTSGDVWKVHQNIVVGGEISEYLIRGRVDLARSALEKRPVFLLDFAGAS